MSISKYHVSKNLFDLSNYYSVDAGVSNIVITENDISYTATGTYRAIRYTFPFPYNSRYAISFGQDSENAKLEIRRLKEGQVVGNPITMSAGGVQILYNSEDYDEVRIYISNGTYIGECKASSIMLNTGSTALPYEPYGNTWQSIPYKRYENGEWVEYSDKKYENGEWT